MRDSTSARLAQSVEHGTLNPRVVGSSPTLGEALLSVESTVEATQQSHALCMDRQAATKQVISECRPRSERTAKGLSPREFCVEYSVAQCSIECLVCRHCTFKGKSFVCAARESNPGRKNGNLA